MALEKQLVFFDIFFLLIPLSQSQNTIIAPSRPIMASVGTDVTLPCQLDPVKDLRDIVVEWARQDLTPRYIHIRRNGLDYLLDQNSLYLGRTALSESRLQKGDMSLSLTKVRPSDGGTYRCYIPQINTKAEVTLLVVSVAPPSVSLTKERSGSPVLRCESRGWYPEPELEWLDSEGTVLLRTEAQRGASDELFTVSSRLSVEQRLGNTFTCRVRQQESDQSREAQLILTDEFLESCASSSLTWILLGSALVLAAAVVLAVWKFKPNRKSKTKNCELGEIEKSRRTIQSEENTPMLRDVTQRVYLKEFVPEVKENLDNDLLYVNDVIDKLSQMKETLMKLKERHQEEIHEMNSLIEVVAKRSVSWWSGGSGKEAKTKEIDTLEKTKMVYKTSIEDLDKNIKTLEDIILSSAKRKGALDGERTHMNRLMKKEEGCQEKRATKEDEEKEKVPDQADGAQSEQTQVGKEDAQSDGLENTRLNEGAAERK